MPRKSQGSPAGGADSDAAGSLLANYDALLLDLDGTVYRGGAVVDGAVAAVDAAHRSGVAVRFVTNNASRTPDDVAAHLTALGVPATVAEVSTSAQAAAGMLAERLPAGGRVLVVGTEALMAEVRGRGFEPVRTAGDGVVAVVQGLSQDSGWRDLAEAALAIRAGALWVACNIDPTLPTERGLLPGNGALVTALRTATGVEPLVAGKPARPLMDEAIRESGGRRPLVVGDRLDTDIAGASAAGVDALLVLTGVSTAADLLVAPVDQRPRFVADDLRGLTLGLAEAAIGEQAGWAVDGTGTGLRLRSTNGRPGAPVAALRALCAAAWAGTGDASAVAGADDAAKAALAELGIGA